MFDSIRFSPEQLHRRMANDIQCRGLCCPKCATNNISVLSASEESVPVIDDTKSTAQINFCHSCGVKWEVAYSICYSMRILATS